MRRSRFSVEQVIGILKEQEAGAATADVCRRHGISSATFYKWKAKHGGLEVSDARRLKSLEDENARLKKLLAEAMLDNAILKDVSAKKVTPDAKRAAAAASGRWERAGRSICRWNPTCAGRWTSPAMPSPTAGGSVSWQCSTTSRANAWRWSSTRRSPALASCVR